MKDAVATMGGVLPDDAGGRDAVHVAVFSATSVERLRPGQHVAIVGHEDRDTKVSPTAEHETVGIVDPFLRDTVKPGTRVWIYLYPRTITALSHRWSHPAFEDASSVYATPANRLASENWLRGWCDSGDTPGYDTVMKAVSLFADGFRGFSSGNDDDPDDDYGGISIDDDVIVFVGSDCHADVPPEFWTHAEIVLGRPIKGERPEYFSCSC